MNITIGDQVGKLPTGKVQALISGLPTFFDDPHQQVVLDKYLNQFEANAWAKSIYVNWSLDTSKNNQIVFGILRGRRLVYRMVPVIVEAL